MDYTRACHACSSDHVVAEADLQPLSRTEQLLCAKENLPFANMVKVVCPNCSTPSLVPRDQLTPR